jgi:hypothetical protein
MNSTKPASDRIGGCPRTRYTGTISPDDDVGTSVASLRRCSTSPTLRASPTSITIPSGGDWGIVHREGTRHQWCEPPHLVHPNDVDFMETTLLQHGMAFRWPSSLSHSLAGGDPTPTSSAPTR